MAERLDAGLLSTLSETLGEFSRSLEDDTRAALSVVLRLASQDNSVILGLEPSRSVLQVDQREIFERLLAEPHAKAAPAAPAAQQLVVVMKATRLCNLRCTYCHSWRSGPGHTMGFEVMARAIRDALAVPGVGHVEFIWHGGETMLLPLKVFRRAVWLQQRFNGLGVRVTNAVQTNGTLLNRKLLTFFRDHRFGVGVSLDGSPEVHDARRKDITGRGTYTRIQSFLNYLQDEQMPHSVLAVIDRHAARAGPRALLEELVRLGVREVGVLNVIPENETPLELSDDAYIDHPSFVNFLCELFDEWWTSFAGKITVRELRDLADGVRGGRPGMCYFAGDCFGRFVTIEADGTVSACDKYVGDVSHRYGSLLDRPLAQALGQSASLRRARTRQEERLLTARSCPWFEVCRGGCPHDARLKRLAGSLRPDGCCGYRPLLERIEARLGVSVRAEEANPVTVRANAGPLERR